MSEPTRSTHTDNITASFFSLFKNQILKRLDFKSQRSGSSRSSIKEVKAPSEDIQEEREKQERGLCPNLIKYPKRAKENSKEDIISTSKIRRPLGDYEEDHQKLKEQEYNIFFKALKAATNLTTRVCPF